MTSAVKTFYLVHREARQRAAVFIEKDAPDGYEVKISEPKKKRIQEEKYHAMIDDYAEQVTYAGQKWDADDMKRILVDEFAEEMRQLGTPLHEDARSRLVPSRDGKRVIQLGIQTRNFWVSEARDFITWLQKQADEHGVRFKNETREKMAIAT